VASAVSVRVDDSSGWSQMSGGTDLDRPWGERIEDLDDALEAWRKNFLVRRIVTLTRSYVVGNGITITSDRPDLQDFITAFWKHPKNRIDRRLGPICDELTRAGEAFPVLFTNRVDGMSYVRLIPACKIDTLETDEDDYETEIQYHQTTNTVDGKWWNGPGHPKAYKRARGGSGGKLEPLMLHFAVNRPVGATRGEGDLTTVLPWARRYSEWLKDRVRLNRQRTRNGLLDVQIADDTQVETKRAQLRETNPIQAGIYVHGQGETVTMHDLNINANDAEKDGRILRQACAVGANVGLHYFGEGDAMNYATAKEMGEPTARFYTDRQTDLGYFLVDLVTAAWNRHQAALGQPVDPADDLGLTTHTAEVARADNESLASAAHDITEALRTMKEQGWITDEQAVRLAFKFAGEVIGEDEVKEILNQTPDKQPENRTNE